MHDGNWHMGWMGLWWSVIIAAIIAVLLFALTSRRRSGNSDSPERELKRRYAKGEIDRDTYDRMLDDLRR